MAQFDRQAELVKRRRDPISGFLLAPHVESHLRAHTQTLQYRAMLYIIQRGGEAEGKGSELEEQMLLFPPVVSFMYCYDLQ